jgi:diacylglycerol kinase (ATP)
MKKIIFIANPLSHEMQGESLEKSIQKNLDMTCFKYEICYTKKAKDATRIAKKSIKDHADIVVAVGGDGTVNEVGNALINSNIPIGIVPVGSGNGLARHFKIPVGLENSIQALNSSKITIMDTAKINQKPFFAIAGIGLDAQIAMKFAKFKKRGLLSYAKVFFQEFSSYKPKTHTFIIDGKTITKKGVIFTFANSSQYGNNFVIAPQADHQDGYLDLVILDDIPTLEIPNFWLKFKDGTLDHSKHFETHRFKELIIKTNKIKAHIDGEPIHLSDEIKVSVEPKSLKILTPDI